MFDLNNSHSLTEFQRNARGFIDDLNETKEPVLITVNGKVEAVLVDPATFQEMEASKERERLIEAVREGIRAVDEGRIRSAEDVYSSLRAKHGL